MAKRKEIVYDSPEEWLKNNRKSLGAFAGEWIAFTNSGVIVHNKSGHTVTQEARQTQLDYALKYVHPLEIPRVIRILPIRVRSLKSNKWQPDYLIELGTSKIMEKLTMLVDSGADISIIPKWTGEDLGLKIDENDYIEKAEGVNGTVDYVIKNLTFNIDGHIFKAPVGWVQTEEVEDILLGREVIFDLFDVEFKQAEETIIFKKRKDTTI
jgi:Aspartyl protease